MSDTNIRQTIIPNHLIDDSAPVDFKEFFFKILKYWYLFVISIIICVSIAGLKATLDEVVWNVSGKIFVDNEDNSTPSGGDHPGLASMITPKNKIEDQLEILTSTSLISQVIAQTNLNIKTYYKERLKYVEVYDYSPIKIDINYKVKHYTGATYDIDILNDKDYTLKTGDGSISLNCHFGDSVKLKQYDLILNTTKYFQVSNKYRIVIQSEDDAISDFLLNFQPGMMDKTSSAIDLSYNYTSAKRGEDVLEVLMSDYLVANDLYIRRTKDSTAKYINDRMVIVYKQLNDVQTKIEMLNRENQIIDIAENSRSLADQANSYASNLDQQSIQISVVNSLENYLNKPGNAKFVPTSVAINNGSLNAGIDNYNSLLLNRDKLKLSLTEENPIIKNLDNQMENARIVLLRSLESYKKSLSDARYELDRQNRLVKAKIDRLPAIEKVYIDLKNQASIQSDLYTYLLRRKEEVVISKSSAFSNTRIIEHARSASAPLAPKKGKIYMLGLIIGLVIPGIYVALKEFLNTMIMSKSDIQRITNIPIVGEIGHKIGTQALVITNDARTNISEQFRSLRTNLQYLTQVGKPNVLLFTSSMSGEGKTFLSLNLGGALALAGKRIIFLELDLRKPNFSKNLGLDNSDGFTNYIISEDLDYHTIIKSTPMSENCFLISSGPIPPNPTELLMNPKLDQLIHNLKKEFDYLIIDTAPVGIVTDALLLEKFADITFYVVREEYTHKPQLELINDLKQLSKIRNPYLIVNDVKFKKAGYGYGYGYGSYGSYGAEEEKPGFFRRVFGK
jgi:tyrosine-protein kinase Etk/Wzc